MGWKKFLCSRQSQNITYLLCEAIREVIFGSKAPLGEEFSICSSLGCFVLCKQLCMTVSKPEKSAYCHHLSLG